MAESRSRGDIVPVRMRYLILPLVAISVPFMAMYIMARPAMPRHLVRQVVPGMTEAEVRDVLGEPQHCGSDGDWEYWRWGNAGWVEVAFREDGTVAYVNDESAFP